MSQPSRTPSGLKRGLSTIDTAAGSPEATVNMPDSARSPDLPDSPDSPDSAKSIGSCISSDDISDLSDIAISGALLHGLEAAKTPKTPCDTDCHQTETNKKLDRVLGILESVLRENFELRNKVSEMEKVISSLTCARAVSGTVDHIVDQVSNQEIEQSVADEEEHVVVEEESPKKHYEVLILSDSIYRHVAAPCPKGEGLPKETQELLKCPAHLPVAIQQEINMLNMECLKVVVPGARAPRLLCEASLLHQQYTFSHVVVHCGANYVPHPNAQATCGWQGRAICETTELLRYIHERMCPSVAFSSILPQPRPPAMTSDINYVNSEISDFCEPRGMEEINHPFSAREGRINAKKFAKDGLHLNFPGVDKLYWDLLTHIRYVLSHPYCEDFSIY